MIHIQIIEQPGADLQKKLVRAMRSGELRTFIALKRGRKIEHKASPGWMNWSSSDGIINCEVLSPRKPGSEWQLFHKLMGRLADRYAEHIVQINVQFHERPTRHAAGGKPKKRRRARR